MSLTDSQEYPIFDLNKYRKIGCLKVKREGETLTTLISESIEEEPEEDSITTYDNSFDRIKFLNDLIILIKERNIPLNEGLASFTESMRPLSECFASISESMRPLTEGLNSLTEFVKPIADFYISLKPIINLKIHDYFKVQIEYRLINFRKDDDDKIIYTKENLRRIRDFLLDLRDLYLESYNSNLELPYIIPGPKHSIDVHWITNQYRLLINFPVNLYEEITVAGHKKRKNIIKLSTNPNNAVKLLSQWLNIVIEKQTS